MVPSYLTDVRLKDFTKKNGMLNMTIFRLTKLKILLLGSAVFPFTNITAAYACTSVVYLFRHAEDTPSGPPALTAVGEQHAKLYPSMVKSYQSRYDICPVHRVYAMYDHNVNGSKGTTNPYNTAKYLAANIGGVKMDIETTDGQKFHLYEKIASSPDGGLAPAVGYGPKSRLFYAMQGILNYNGSVAIFWTQQGMPDVSTALGVAPVFYKPTEENPEGDPAFSWPGRLRSSVNIFNWSGVDYSAQYVPFGPSPSPQDAKPRQCFNFDGGAIVGGRYYCTYSGNIQTATKPNILTPNIPTTVIPNIMGNFCVDITPIFGNSYSFGYCR